MPVNKMHFTKERRVGGESALDFAVRWLIRQEPHEQGDALQISTRRQRR